MRKFYVDLKRYIPYSIYSAKVTLKSEVANSYLNWIWWVLEPILNMIVYTTVFKNVFGRSDITYPVFIYSGVVTWGFFSRSITYSVKAMRSNKGIVTKVYIPKYVILLSNLFLNLFKMVVGLLVMIPMLFWFDIPIRLEFLLLIPMYICLFLLTFGFTMIFMHFGVFIDDLGHAVTILLHVLMYLSGIFYNVDKTLKGPIKDAVEKFNPMAYFIAEVRHIVLGTGTMDYVALYKWYIVAFLLIICGVMVIYKYENSYVKVI